MISLLESFGMIEENAHPFVARPIVTSIRASPVNPHVAVALERYPGLLILEWREGRFEVYGLLELPRDPLDVCFDRKGDLWITLSTPENTEQDSSEELLRLYSYANNLTRVHAWYVFESGHYTVRRASFDLGGVWEEHA
ncbi:MAG: hypothetical protein BJ554DRAFT_6727 [Olpidium bornovanus]|uniref:Uncharacterized protein n=1 Tax=Olpidium bornovanus TaxID=278681 RepID=A0A8H7ZX24_9FUNG|nr:MAG: hypothetical protein BJ554DRAFT_6727 [Olpidium bornovanus]